jgi:hypothetical protein
MQTGIGCMLMRGAGTVRWVTFLPEVQRLSLEDVNLRNSEGREWRKQGL